MCTCACTRGADWADSRRARGQEPVHCQNSEPPRALLKLSLEPPSPESPEPSLPERKNHLPSSSTHFPHPRHMHHSLFLDPIASTCPGPPIPRSFQVPQAPWPEGTQASPKASPCTRYTWGSQPSPTLGAENKPIGAARGAGPRVLGSG